MQFRDRAEAGQQLAARLHHLARQPNLVVLALPRGGVPIGYEVATLLGAALDVFIVRKLGAPGQPELAIGAIASGGDRVLNYDVIDAVGLSSAQIEQIADREAREIARQERVFRGGRPPLTVEGHVVILVDDGLATGATMRAAVESLRRHRPQQIVVAVPVAAPQSCRDLEAVADEVICAVTPDPFYAVGLWYVDFSQTTDDEVRRLLDRAEARENAANVRS